MPKTASDAYKAIFSDDNAVLIFWCADALSGTAEAVQANRVTPATLAEASRVGVIVSKVIATRADTLRGLKAKAALYKLIPSEELADALASDILAFQAD